MDFLPIMLRMGVRDVLNKFDPLPLPPKNTFAGQVVCVTGSTAGVGLAAAIHCLNLGADEVIITCRDAARGAAAKQRIEDATVGRLGTVTLMELEMTSYASVQEFCKSLKKVRAGRGGIDYLLLNAAVIRAEFAQSPEGWQEEIQVQVLSTTLIALLVLPWMIEERKNRDSAAHLAFASSVDHVGLDIARWLPWASSGKERILDHWNKRENWPPGLSGGYTVTKVLQMYAFREIAKMCINSSGIPDVIMSAPSPGITYTEIARHVTAASWVFQIIQPYVMGAFFKSPDNAARVYILSGLTKEEEHGKTLERYVTEKEHEELLVANYTSPAGKAMQARVWKEIVDELSKVVPGLV